MHEQNLVAEWTVEDQKKAEMFISQNCPEDTEALSTMRGDFAAGTRALSEIVSAYLTRRLGNPSVPRLSLLYDIMAVVFATTTGLNIKAWELSRRRSGSLFASVTMSATGMPTRST